MGQGEFLPGRSGGVVRIGDTVRKPRRPWTDSVDRLLAHLERVGFEGAPRPLGRDAEGRQVLSWLDGDVAAGDHAAAAWTDERRDVTVLRAAASLLREYHDAVGGYTPDRPMWSYDGPRALTGDEIVSHGDVGYWNVVFHGVRPIGLIDFDAARPQRPLVEAAQAAWAMVPLWGPDELGDVGLTDVADRFQRLSVFAEAYGVDDTEAFAQALLDARLEQLSLVRRWPVTPSDAAEHLRRVADDLDRLWTWLPEVCSTLGVGADELARRWRSRRADSE